MKIKVSKNSREKFEYFSQCSDTKRLPEILIDLNGHSALECFHVHETFGKTLPCKEPELLSKALNGKEWHGLTVTNCAEDYVGRILFASDIKENYPEWVQKDIFGRAKQIAMKTLGFVPKFVEFPENEFTLYEQFSSLPRLQS